MFVAIIKIVILSDLINKKVKNYSNKDDVLDDKVDKEFLDLKRILLCKK